MPEINARLVSTIALALLFSSHFARASETDVCVAAAERAQVERRKTQLITARNDLVACSREICPHQVRDDCKGWLAEVDEALPSIVPSFIDENGADVSEVSVSSDGAPLLGHLDGRAVAINPGAHTIVFFWRNTSFEQKIVVREGEHDRAVTVRAPKTLSTRTAEPTSSPGISPAVWVLGGAGVLALGSAVGFWVSGRDARSDLYDTCGKTGSCTNDDVDASKRTLVIGDVLAGVGVAAIGAAIVIAIVVHPNAAPTDLRTSFSSTTIRF
ncbi:MAG: hypothetical protein ABI461_02295 [Polyangiaceae bacterium]